jgi:RHH-type transcriptional regulator, proline utilization regulon repressor / proline dehydrogenase / delta 1-pyrroline-5-carboxylate dehydrogenase
VEALDGALANPGIEPAGRLFGPSRRNSRGWDLADPLDLEALEEARAPWRHHRWRAAPMLAAGPSSGTAIAVTNPACAEDVVGYLVQAGEAEVEAALTAAAGARASWSGRTAAARADCLRRAADLYEANSGELFALATREAGKIALDCVGEVREAVDFLRYYAAEAERLGDNGSARGIFACISPWNFPLAIFTGQIAAALAAGNAVVAKPAEQTR